MAAARLVSRRKPRKGTKQQQVLAMLRRPEGATVAQIAEATGWQAHTVPGFFAGLKKRQGIAIVAAERMRQVVPARRAPRAATPFTTLPKPPDEASAARCRKAGGRPIFGFERRAGA